MAQRCGTCYYPLELKAILSLLDFFRGRFGDFSILSLQKMLLPYAYFLPMGTYRRYSERQLQVRMTDSFSDLFPTYRLLGQEYLLPRRGPGRSSGHGGGPRGPLRAQTGERGPHATVGALRPGMFQDPILIGVTEKALPGALCRPHVTYYTYHSLNDLVLEHLRERQLRMPGGDLTQLRELVLSCYSY